MNTRKTPERVWLDRTHSVIKWTLKTPEIHNPFDASINVQTLDDMINDRSILMESCQVVAIMDETEILRIKDLTSLKFQTEHPNLMHISMEDLDGYLNEHGVWKVLETKFDAFREQCKAELEKRQNS